MVRVAGQWVARRALDTLRSGLNGVYTDPRCCFPSRDVTVYPVPRARFSFY